MVMAFHVQSQWTPTSKSQYLLRHSGKIMDWDKGGKVEFALHELFIKYSYGDVLWNQSIAA